MDEHEPTKAHRPESPTGQDETTDSANAESRVESEHPVEEQLIAFIACQLQEPHVNWMELHLAECGHCVRRIRSLYGSISSIVSGLQEEPTSSPPSPEQAATVGYDYEVGKNTSEFGDYALIDEIARGGMGVVYRARHLSLNRIVALKMIKSGELANQEQVERFYKEAEAAANLDHPGIVPVYDVGEVDGKHFFTMALVDGDSLSVRLRKGPLPPEEAARYAKSIAEAVAYAHSKGVIHRDLKPGNVLITKEGTLRITDFGLAKRIEEDSELTSTGQVLGTPSYMPPEQAEGKLTEIAPAADIYSIGATLYCMLVGRPPFQSANVIETLNLVLEADPVSPRTVNLNIPLDLETLCLKCLEKKPSNRYPLAQELFDELNRFLNGEPIEARPIGRVERVWRWCKRKPAQAIAVAAVITLAVGGPLSAVSQSLANRRTAIARVETLLNASPATIQLVLDELDRDASIVESTLRDLDSKKLETPERIRVSLALLPYDSSQIETLKEQINDCTYDELEVLLGRFRSHGGSRIVVALWTEFRNEKLSQDEKFRIGIALAALDSDSENWQEDDYQLLVNSMLAVNTVYQPAVRRSLAPMASKLVGAVKAAYESAEAETLADESSANAIVDFAANDSELISDLSISSTPKQHSVVFPVVESLAASDETVVDKFVEITKLQPGPDDDEATRIKLGKQRAGAAINLVRLDKLDEAMEALRIKEDPESLTQFVHDCKARGITVEQLLDLLNRATTVSERCGILLGLGEFAVSDIPEDIRSTWVEHVKALYANDPSSGIHGASGWLLRQWGYVEEAKATKERAIPYSEDREWFTLKINLAGPMEFEDYSYLTFVVFSEGDYEIGSQEYELDRDSLDEKRRGVTITRRFAVLDREVTFGEIKAITDFGGFSNMPSWSKDPLVASAGMNWYMAVKFCRGLSRAAGIEEDSQSYLDPKSLDSTEYPIDPSAHYSWDREGPQNWPLDLSKEGFRLPTNAEWEIACRGVTVTRYGFGSDVSHLGSYGWYADSSSNRGHRPGELRPNLRGLYDMHGNMYEWCHDWVGGNTVDVLIDPMGPMGPLEGSSRVLRGGGWIGSATFCRAASRFHNRPTDSRSNDGFRIALSIGVSSSHPE